MTLMMKTCFFSLAILFLWQVQDGAEACSCVNIPPEQVFCRADMVFRATVRGRRLVDTGNGPMKSVRYDVQVTKLFKGSSRHFDAVYTSSSVGACGATLNVGEQPYVLTGRMDADGAVHITMCDFHALWDDLTFAQRRNLNQCGQSACVC
ncbi:metalloproteinase inhibitor 2 [Nematolebias whitei]|uniref:metalloproteinase inhibitor 2 n=1 Tax=Nematolebias whitei TaxID=451745 RepID=UPI00189AD874|nr:metalloproteinase inhibitor 2 [Nematolebias whitei]